MSVLRVLLVAAIVGCAAAVQQQQRYDDPPPRKSAGDRSHECGNHDDDGPSTMAVRSPFRPQSTTASDDPYTGRGVVLGKYWASFPFIRTYRLVLGSFKSYSDQYSIRQRVAERVEELNTMFYERDLGVHFVLVAAPISDEDVYDGSIGSSTRYFKQEVGGDNFEAGLYIRPDRDSGGFCATGGINMDGSKGHCIAHWGLAVIGHELGHLLGARHPHVGVDKMEPGEGFSLMSYGQPRVLFNLGNVLQINAMFERSSTLEIINNTNARPQINVQKSRLRPQWKIPHSTAFRFKVDANDPDEDDQLMYYVQQLNFEQADSRNPSYRDLLLGGYPYFVNPEVTADRDFYFCTRYQYTKRAGYIVKNTSMTHRDTYTYDMFVNVFDSNEAKRQRFVSSYDGIVKDYTTQLIQHRDDSVRTAELNAAMRSSLSAYAQKNESWLPKRDTYHVQVIALKNQTPFSVDIRPKRDTYYADDEVALTWDYDSATIPPGDHVTIRFSVDGLASFPYVVKRSIPASERTATFRVPEVPTDKGFFIVEHDEGIVFAPTNVGTNQGNKVGKEGAFTIRARDVRGRWPKLTPAGPVIVKDIATLKAFLAKVSSSISQVSYILADENGTALGVYSQLSINADAILQRLRENKGTYCRLVAVTGTPPSIGENVVDAQTRGYRNGATQFVSNAVEIKLYSRDAVRVIPEDESWARDAPTAGDDTTTTTSEPGPDTTTTTTSEPGPDTTTDSKAETPGQSTKGTTENKTKSETEGVESGFYSPDALSLLFCILVFSLF